MLSRLANIIQSAADALFMPWVVGILLGAGLFLTIRTGAVQLRRFGEAGRLLFVRQSTGEAGALTPFQAFMTALAASIGTGNIAGVATAIVSGGPGALFWIWVYGFVATAIKFAEAVLGVTYRDVRRDTVLSGPMYYLRDGLRSPVLAWTFAFVAAVAALTTTPFTQPNSMALVLDTVAGIPRIVSGVVIAILTWLVIIGGIKSIGRAADRRTHRDCRECEPDPRRARDGCPRSLHYAVGARIRHVYRDALWHRPRHLRERGGLRHGSRRVWHRKE
jgi:AGCS family alanine or glycine:cation symporter